MIAEPNRDSAEHEAGVSYPIQPGKVQAPALRDETLARTRLLDWLHAKIHSRVVFVIADAGYGKTTLLADFSRRTRLRTIWYRLDEDDRDWVGFLSHLIAAGREHEPGFAPRTAAMLRSIEPGGPTRDDAVESFLAELPAIASQGAALVFDDFHLADEIGDVRQIAREIVARGPERLSIVFASRRQPPIPVTKLRALGEVAELGLDDLRFSDAELEQLFRETYGRPLEPDVLTELAKRTEGWAASLTLVQAALRERSPSETRSFIRGLSGARDELHDYLAEEVVGDLPLIHQQFLMRTSVLQVVTPELAQVATDLQAVEVQSLILESERLGLLGRRPSRRSTAQRYHPLVREFLEERLLREVGAPGVRELHIKIARWAETTDWRTAAYHFAAAQRWDDLRRVLDTYVETIVASGDFAAAANLLRGAPVSNSSWVIEVIRSRVAMAEGDYVESAALANRASELAPNSDIVVGNQIAASMLQGRYGDAVGLFDQFSRVAKTPLMRDVAAATRALVESSLTGDVGAAARRYEALAEDCRASGLSHFEGVSWLNAGLSYVAAGRISDAHSSAVKAVELLSTSSSGAELAAAVSLDAAVSGLEGQLEQSRTKFETTLALLPEGPRSEVLSEYAEIEVLVGDAERAYRLLAPRDRRIVNSSTALVELIDCLIVLRRGDPAQAFRDLLAMDADRPSGNVGFLSRIKSARALAASLISSPDAKSLAVEAVQLTTRQGAGAYRVTAEVALAHETGDPNPAIVGLPEGLAYALSFCAELVVRDLRFLDDRSMATVTHVATEWRERWRQPLRKEIADEGPSRLHAARLLDQIGDLTDIASLRRIARDKRSIGSDRQLGRGLARRLAPIASVHDMGRTTVEIGDRLLGSGEVRRKVLALLCFLLSRPRWAATREEVMEAMWPEIDPTSAINSLNQSVYFLRRVFEPNYSEETTAGYVHQDSDVLWLDEHLVQSASRRCAQLVAEFGRTGSPETAVELSQVYTGKFALDFSYDEWATDYREWLHVAYIHVVETQIRIDVDHGDYQRGILLARRALEIEPRHDELELSLLRLLRGSGAHSAAAEQYLRYSHVLRNDLGVDPPPIDRLGG
jgi:ATP/maltotriose-dependent transcriptional regulator MalT/DNA-binding SARP family transcriptional activator